MASNKTGPTIAIIGGGVTGAAIGYHLARWDVGAFILVFEPRHRLGPGLAYDTSEDVLRVNVPATRMTLRPEDETHFARWLKETRALHDDPCAQWQDGETYPRRAVFGAYVAAELEPFLASGHIRHVREQVNSVSRTQGSWRIGTDGGAPVTADYVVIATTHPRPRLPSPLAALAGDRRLLADGLDSAALRHIGAKEQVLIVGAGLTAADVIAVLDAQGHRGHITMISRRGLRARPQPAARPAPYGDFTTAPARTARTLLMRARLAIEEAAAQGASWHAVIDALRMQGDVVWNALPLAEQRRLLSHLRPFWDAHRFRVAPQVGAVLDRKFADGSLDFFAASLKAAAIDGDAAEVRLHDRRRQQTIERRFERIVVTTGPAHTEILAQQPYLAELAEAGFVALDPTGLGLHTSRDGRAIGRGERAEPGLFIAGPLARGTFGELMGVPQVAKYAAFIAQELREATEQAARRFAVASGS
jgi:uncharacterized NAD(P)/FAD-binding protein YdhS